MNGRWYIYVLIDSSGARRYVGATMDLPARFRAHQRTRPWVTEFAVLESTFDSWEARDLERAWVRRLTDAGWDLENVRLNPVKYLTGTSARRTRDASRRDLPACGVARRHGAAKRLQPTSHDASRTSKTHPQVAKIGT